MQTIEPSPYSELLFAGINLSTTLINFLILSILLMLSAFASSSESAYFSLGPKEKENLKNDDSKGAQTALKLLEKPKELLATLLILNNFVNIGIVILSSFLLDELFPLNEGNKTFRFFLDVVAITFMLLLIGEVIPKIYANKNAELLANDINFNENNRYFVIIDGSFFFGDFIEAFIVKHRIFEEVAGNF